MTEHFTREEAMALAKAAGFDVRRGLGLRESAPEDVFARGLINEEVTALCNAAAVAAKLKEWDVQGAAAKCVWGGKIEHLHEGPPSKLVGALLYTHPLPAQPAEPVKLEDIEQYRMQMAGISTAALGYWTEGDSIHPDYDTLALRDVAKLYAKYDMYFKLKHARPEDADAAAKLKEWEAQGAVTTQGALTQPAKPVVGVPAFPERIMRQLIIMADRVGDEFHGPWEDGNGEPLQDDADAAIAWIASAQPQQKEG